MKDEEKETLIESLAFTSRESSLLPLPSSDCVIKREYLIDRILQRDLSQRNPVISVAMRSTRAAAMDKSRPQSTGVRRVAEGQDGAMFVINSLLEQDSHKCRAGNSIVEYLLKMTMFLVTITCLQLLKQADCQKMYRHSQGAHQDRLIHDHHQRQAFNQLLRSSGDQDNSSSGSNNNFNNQRPQNFFHNQLLASSFANQHQSRTAERRASGGGAASQVPPTSNQIPLQNSASHKQQQHEHKQDNGKLLVCYYTTRQSAPYWPKDAREYVIPADGINSINGAADLSQATFAPILQYEPFKSAAGGPSDNGLGAHQQSMTEFGYDANLNIKNQQQQLVFKSMQLPQLLGGPLLLNTIGKSIANAVDLSASSNNNISSNNGNSAKQHQDAISQMLASAELQHQQQLNSPVTQQQTLVIATSAAGDNLAANKNKQTTAYSFIGGGGGELDAAANNGFIVGGGSGGTIAPAISTLLQQANGGVNDFIMSSGKDKSGPSQLDRSPLKQQQQQLVFSPSLSRAFIVGNPGHAANLNNEVLDTKSQLFIQAQQAHAGNNNNQYHQQTSANPPYQSDAVVKGKSLKQTQQSGEQVSGGASSHHPFSGPVSSTPSVPLSLVNSMMYQSAAPATYRSHPQHFSSSPSTNQLLISSSQSSGNSPKSPTVAFAANTNSASSLKQLPYAISNADGSGGKTLPASSSSASGLQSQASAGSSTLSNGINSSSSQASSSVGASLSSALVSSPLSTMFDVFGAASQYLMRFKPSSLMSPAALSFNTVSADHHNHHNHHNSNQQASAKSTNSSSSSLLASTSSAGSSSSSLIPLPFASSLVSSLQKSTLTSNDRVSSQGIGSGILSRFSLQNTQQRREDVCGRTIQTPERRIIGGEGAKYGEFPYQVHIKIAKHQCGGALVDRQSIVTAAHCVYHFITRAPVSKLQIVIGAYDIEDEQYQELPPQYFKVNKVKLHPNFRFSASHPDRYDIAILKLDKPVKYTDNVLPVCLPSKDLKFESVVGTVTGFGKTDPSLSNRYGTRLLQKVDVPIIENNECERWHRTRGIDLKIFPEMMCAGYEDGLKDACVGDSGGPLVVKTATGLDGSFRWTLAGITSAGFGCAQSRQPGIYHRVSHTVDWILENLD